MATTSHDIRKDNRFRAGWERHDMAVSLLASAMFPACLASTIMRPARIGAGQGARGGPGFGDAWDRARSSAAMVFQLPG